MCSVSLNYHNDLQRSEDPISEEDRSYELPGGKIIQVNHRQRFKATEILFNPGLIGIEEKGIVEMAYHSIEKCDPDLRINLYNNIVLAGGTTVMPGFKDRFEDEIIILCNNPSGFCVGCTFFPDLFFNLSWPLQIGKNQSERISMFSFSDFIAS